MVNPKTPVFAFALCLIAATHARCQITFDDGGEHLLQGEVSEQLVVSHGSQLDLQAVLNPVSAPHRLVVDHAAVECNGCRMDGDPFVGWLETRLSNQASLVLNEGNLMGVTLSDSSITLNGGDILSSGLLIDANERSLVTINDGAMGCESRGCTAISARQLTDVLINGGSIGGGFSPSVASPVVSIYDSATLRIRGGQIAGVELTDNARARMSGGLVRLDGGIPGYGSAVVMTGTSEMLVTSGSVSGEFGFDVRHDARLKITGGQIDAVPRVGSEVGGVELVAHDRAIVTIYGSDFNYPSHEVIQSLDGTITGKLADGKAIEWAFTRDPQAVIVLSPFIPGDYDLDGVLSLADLDLQSIAIHDAYPDFATYDENGDGRIDVDDRVIWVSQHRATWIGDANLDGEFSSTDFIQVFFAGEYEDDHLQNSTWAEGDWNGDREFTSQDMILAFRDGGYEAGPRTPPASVPEPTGLLLHGLAMTFVLLRRFIRNRSECV